MNSIRGTFSIVASPLESSNVERKLNVSRMKFEKRFSGDLEGTSVVSMLGFMNKESQSGGYVAMERVEASLKGRSGSFHLQHSSFMEEGKSEQNIKVIPNSGTGELAGISGQMKIEIVNGEHFFSFDYELPK